MSEKFISIAALMLSIVVAVYVFREMSHTRAKVGEIKFLKNTTVNIESRLLDISKQLKKNKKKDKYTIPDDSSTSSDEYDVLASSGSDESDIESDIESDHEDIEPVTVEKIVSDN
jgi:hypothetical protein